MNAKKMLLIFALSLGSFSAFSETTTTKTTTETHRTVVEKDNTALNRNDQVTAEAQANGSDADVEVTRQLREKIMADDKFSLNAQNVKIVTVGKTITLEGPVANKAEKMKIEKLARQTAGNKKIHNKLTY